MSRSGCQSCVQRQQPARARVGLGDLTPPPRQTMLHVSSSTRNTIRRPPHSPRVRSYKLSNGPSTVMQALTQHTSHGSTHAPNRVPTYHPASEEPRLRPRRWRGIVKDPKPAAMAQKPACLPSKPAAKPANQHAAAWEWSTRPSCHGLAMVWLCSVSCACAAT